MWALPLYVQELPFSCRPGQSGAELRGLTLTTGVASRPSDVVTAGRWRLAVAVAQYATAVPTMPRSAPDPEGRRRPARGHCIRRRWRLTSGSPSDALGLRRERPYNEGMADDSADALATRLRTAFDLCELGESMRRAQLCREHPDATGEEIEALLVTWLQTRPGAEHGDSWGRSISWPPSRS